MIIDSTSRHVVRSVSASQGLPSELTLPPPVSQENSQALEMVQVVEEGDSRPSDANVIAEAIATLTGESFRPGGTLSDLSNEQAEQARIFAISQLFGNSSLEAITALSNRLRQVDGGSPEFESLIAALASTNKGLLSLTRSLNTRPELRIPVLAEIMSNEFVPLSALSREEAGEIYRTISAGFESPQETVRMLSFRAASTLVAQCPYLAPMLRREIFSLVNQENSPTVWCSAIGALATVSQPCDIDRALEWLVDPDLSVYQRNAAFAILQHQSQTIIESAVGGESHGLYERVLCALTAQTAPEVDASSQLAARQTLLGLAVQAVQVSAPISNSATQRAGARSSQSVVNPRLTTDVNFAARVEVAHDLFQQAYRDSNPIQAGLMLMNLHNSGTAAHELLSLLAISEVPRSIRESLTDLAEEMIAYDSNLPQIDQANREALQAFLRRVLSELPDGIDPNEAELRQRLMRLVIQ